MKHQACIISNKDLGLGSVVEKVDRLLEVDEAFRNYRRDQQALGVLLNEHEMAS